MKKIWFLCIFYGISCKHYPTLSPHLAQPMVSIDYSVDTLQCNHCLEVPIPPSNLAYKQIDYQQTPPILRALGMNPNDNRELMYTQIVFGKSVMNTFSFNSGTQETKLVDEGITFGAPKWHANDWILLAKADAIYKVKSNGAQLSKLMDYTSNTGCTWNPDGTQFAFYPYANNSLLQIADLSGKITDSLLGEPAYASFFDWSHPSFFARQRTDGSIVGLNPQNRTRELFVEPLGQPNGFCWLEDHATMVVATMQGLFITNTSTKQIKKIRCACSSTYYKDPLYAAQQHKIFAIKVTAHSANPPNNTKIIVSTSIVKMNLDGTHEEVIEIPK